MNDEAQAAAAKIKRLLDGKAKGFRNDSGGRYHIEVAPEDVTAVAEAIPAAQRGLKARELLLGAKNAPPRWPVAIQADCAHDLIAQYDETQAAAPASAKPALAAVASVAVKS
jgi:hypothetical protein